MVAVIKIVKVNNVELKKRCSNFPKNSNSIFLLLPVHLRIFFQMLEFSRIIGNLFLFLIFIIINWKFDLFFAEGFFFFFFFWASVIR